MAVVFSCPCGQQYSVDESLVGSARRCKKCGGTMVVPKAGSKTVDDFEIGEDDVRTAVAPGKPPVVMSVAAGKPPAVVSADEASEADADDAAAPSWFQGYVTS